MRCASAPTRPGRPAARWSTPSSPHPASTPTTRGRIAPPTWFFFSSRRRHTRLTCDWSSDVCSSDLVRMLSAPFGQLAVVQSRDAALANWRSLTTLTVTLSTTTGFVVLILGFAFHWQATRAREARSEERRVGKECRARWAAYHEIKNR